MKNDLNVRTVGIVGCGLIGMSWAAYYLAKGFAVRSRPFGLAGGEEVVECRSPECDGGEFVD
jgi:hypothetical protein